MKRLALALCLVAAAPLPARSQELVPLPGFTSGYEAPAPAEPRAAPLSDGYIDLALLVLALSLASYLAIRKRSRRGVLLVTIASLIYFGFVREGCVCPIGAIQNVTLALTDATYTIPLVVLGFFLLPLAFTLLFGRTFCAAVCPLGAIQDVVILRPLKVPTWLEHALGLGPYAILGATVLLVATGSEFLLCRYDPFVAFFRRSGDRNMLIFGACLLAAGMFLARPYCRYLCPYGAILRHLSRLSKWHVTITPTECVQCRLCEESCPFGAIQTPTPERRPPRAHGRATLAAMLLLLPVLIALGAWGGSKLAGPLRQTNYTVRLAEIVRRQEFVKDLVKRARPGLLTRDGRAFDLAVSHGERQVVCRDVAAARTLWERPAPRPEQTPSQAILTLGEKGVWVIVRPKQPSDEKGDQNVHAVAHLDAETGRPLWSDRVPLRTDRSHGFRNGEAFGASRVPEGELYAQLYARADALRGRFRWGGAALGAFLALVVGLKLTQLAVRRTRADYLADRATCLSCARCFKYCPVDREDF